MRSDIEDNRLLSTEDFDFEYISETVSEFGLHARSAERLPGYEDANFLVEGDDGEKVILKLTSSPDALAFIEAEAGLLEHLAIVSPELPVPRIIRSRSGRTHAKLEAGSEPIIARVQGFLPGRLYMSFRPQSSGLRVTLGERLGELDKSLSDFNHAAFERTHEWDISIVPRLRELLENIQEAARRDQIESIIDRFEKEVVPQMGQLRQSLIHGDANYHNILVSVTATGIPYVSGIVDFGDAMRTITVADAAIGCAYAMLGEADPIGAATDVISGYHRTNPLEPNELEVLYPLILGRLALSAVYSARWRAEQGDSEYHTVSEQAVWSLLDDLKDIHADFAHHALRHACGLAASPSAARVVEYLQSARSHIGPVLPPDIEMARGLVFDMSASSSDPGGPDERLDAAAWTRELFERMKAVNAGVGIGRYDEPRICYDADQFLTRSGERRTIHLGVDLFASPGTTVLAPLDGHVHSFRDNNLELDYGPTIVLEHRAEPGGVCFYTLYGHLSRDSLSRLANGMQVARGDQIGSIGPIAENGGWPPHVHFQIVSHMYGGQGNFPGVAAPSSRRFWTELCPDPNLILRIPESLFPAPPMIGIEIRTARSNRLGRNLSLSYRDPLHIVRGFAQYLYDSSGRQYLDCVNNVAHVGHCHPRVVAAASRQMSVLNTNTRYLHENIVRYAERLAATMPDPLRVCYFVNSGSEANDLALRLARMHTGARDVLVLGSAYHGHLTSLIEVSPYKAEGRGGVGLPEHVHRLSAPDRFRGPYRNDGSAAAEYASEAATVLADMNRNAVRPAAFIAESALGCAGQIMLPDGYLSNVYSRVRSAGAVCIADEVQVGFGRIGTHFWAFESQGVVPDIVTLGKPIGNGHPIGAVVTTAEIAASFDNGMEYFNTFGGSPVSAAVGLAVLDVIRDEDLQRHAHDVGTALLRDLNDLRKRHPIVGDVRGAGLFIGIELVRGDELRPAARQADYLINRLKEQGVLLSKDGPDHNVIKFKPPMPFSMEDGERLVSLLDTVLSDDFLR